jgi:hypothetical protein
MGTSIVISAMQFAIADFLKNWFSCLVNADQNFATVESSDLYFGGMSIPPLKVKCTSSLRSE